MAEIQTFLSAWAADPVVYAFVSDSLPPWGATFQDGYGTLLLWTDPTGRKHIVDVTNMPIAQKVNDAPFHSPDESFVGNLLEELKKLIESLKPALDWAPVILAAALFFGGAYLLRR